MHINAGNWYFHAYRLDKGEREWAFMADRFHRWIPIVTIWAWFCGVTFGHLGGDDE